jgi:Carboxypeptidase regulatory-like domain
MHFFSAVISASRKYWLHHQKRGSSRRRAGGNILGLSLALFTLLFSLAIQVRAQSFTAAMTGTVTDQTGAVVAGAKVEIRNTGTNEVRALTTDAAGLYTASQLAPGQYQLSVTAPSFKNFIKTGIVLEGSQRAEHNAQLQLGSAGQSVEVSATTIAVDSQTANREVTLDTEQAATTTP